VATDRFFVETPGLGSSLMAGFGTTRSGWDGGHVVSGRPGYAWYFGRDSVWTALAMLAYGDHRKVHSVLEFLGNFQDITGKIAHEITTSGHVHYDAADATPLYILLTGRYLRASNDRRFARREFPRLLKAVNFCFATDSDHDHLIENTNVGHGWIEGGPLFPSHAELYLNACWCSALEEAAFVAGSLKRRKEREKWMREATRVRRIINKDFWNQEEGFYSFAKNEDGTFNIHQTILATVAMYLGVLNHDKSVQCLQTFASDRFSTPWGVRMIARDDKLYNPEGYHCGSVWPLFTGWTALAELQHGLRDEALKHIKSSIELYNKFSLGFIPEVLHGEQCKPAGVCSHQAWSEALPLLGILELQQVANKESI
jgi:glycogen debranching enzyme